MKLQYYSRFTLENSRNKDVFVLQRWYLDILISVQISLYLAKSTKPNVFLPDYFPPVIKWLAFLAQIPEATPFSFSNTWEAGRKSRWAKVSHVTLRSFTTHSPSCPTPHQQSISLGSYPPYMLPHLIYPSIFSCPR